MAKLTFIDINDGEYTVQRDDGSMYKRFDNYSEAKNYEIYLQQLDDEKKVIQQNEQLIANQQRLIELQQRQHQQLPVQKPHIDPEYLAWKKEKAEKEAQKRKVEAELSAQKEARQNAYLCEYARKLDNGETTISILDGLNIENILKKNLYKFSSSRAILEISNNIHDKELFNIFWKQYCNNKEIITKVIGSNAFIFASSDIIKQLLKEYDGDTEIINNILMNASSYTMRDVLRVSEDPSLVREAINKRVIDFASGFVDETWWKDRLYWLDNKEKFLSGDIVSVEDIEFAEKYYYFGMDSFAFNRTLASKSKKNETHESICSNIVCGRVKHKISDSKAIDVLQLLLVNPYVQDKTKRSIAWNLIDILTTEESLQKIKKYVVGSPSDFYHWKERLKELGFSDNYGHESSSNINASNSSSQEGCIWLLICVLSPLIYLLIDNFTK